MPETDDAIVQLMRLQLAQLESDASTLRSAIDVLERRLGIRTAKRGDGNIARRRSGNSSITGYIMKFLPAAPSRQWDANDVYDAMMSAGWQPSDGIKDPLNGVRTALARLADRGEIKRVGQGLYQCTSPPLIDEMAALVKDAIDPERVPKFVKDPEGGEGRAI